MKHRDFLISFFRLWFFEFAWDANHDFSVAPHPWLRTGPGNARDGKPKFDLSRFNQSYFERLRASVTAALLVCGAATSAGYELAVIRCVRLRQLAWKVVTQ